MHMHGSDVVTAPANHSAEAREHGSNPGKDVGRASGVLAPLQGIILW